MEAKIKVYRYEPNTAVLCSTLGCTKSMCLYVSIALESIPNLDVKHMSIFRNHVCNECFQHLLDFFRGSPQISLTVKEENI